MSFVVEPLDDAANKMLNLEQLGFAADYELPEKKWVVDRSENVFLVTASVTRHRAEA